MATNHQQRNISIIDLHLVNQSHVLYAEIGASLFNYEGMYIITNSLVYVFHNCVCLRVSYADEVTWYSVVICHHDFEFG